jgi:hypothetical protein
MSEKILLAYQNTKDKSLLPLIKQQEQKHKVYQLIPDRFIQEGKIVEEILTSISALHDFPMSIKDKCLIYNPFQPIYYEILYDNRKISFQYVIPELYDQVLSNKIKSIYRTATFIEKKDYFSEYQDKYYCIFKQKKHFMFSLNVDYRENGMIEGFLTMINNLQEDDKLLLQIGIVPQDDGWKTQWKNAYLKYKKGDKLEINSSIIGTVMDKTFDFADGLLSVVDMFVGQKPLEKSKAEEKMFDMTNFEASRQKRMTLQKVQYSGYQVQIKLFCTNDLRCRYYGKILDGIFKLLDAEQEIEFVKTKLNQNLERKFDFQHHKNVFSTKELAIFMQMPNRRMQIDFKEQLPSIENRESEIPKSLLDKKGLTIGIYTYKGEKQTVYFPADRDNSNYSLLLSGFQRTGKTSFMANYAIESTVKGHSNFIIDTIKNCDLSNTIRDYMPESHKNKIVSLDFSNMDWIIPLTWNENSLESGTSRERLLKASTLAGSFENFIDTVNASDENERLSPKMKRYLSSAVRLALQHSDSTIYDIILCLTDYVKRHEFIDKSGLNTNSKTIQDMLMLDDGKGGTNYKEIQGIVDRISVLMNDMYLELFLSTPINHKVNFQYWADNGYCVLLKIPELHFSPVAINCLVSFLYSKIWLALLTRTGNVDKLPHVHIIGDECHKFGNSILKMLYGAIRESAKYKTNFVISAHTLIDLKTLLPVFRASGAHYMLFKSSPQNYKMLENELLPYTMEELMQTKPFHSINVINANRDQQVFLTESPKPAEKVYKFFDRSYLDLECSKKYGVEYKD